MTEPTPTDPVPPALPPGFEPTAPKRGRKRASAAGTSVLTALAPKIETPPSERLFYYWAGIHPSWPYSNRVVHVRGVTFPDTTYQVGPKPGRPHIKTRQHDCRGCVMQLSRRMVEDLRDSLSRLVVRPTYTVTRGDLVAGKVVGAPSDEQPFIAQGLTVRSSASGKPLGKIVRIRTEAEIAEFRANRFYCEQYVPQAADTPLLNYLYLKCCGPDLPRNQGFSLSEDVPDPLSVSGFEVPREGDV